MVCSSWRRCVTYCLFSSSRTVTSRLRLGTSKGSELCKGNSFNYKFNIELVFPCNALKRFADVGWYSVYLYIPNMSFKLKRRNVNS